MINSIHLQVWTMALLSAAAVSLCTATCRAADWPQWRGPQRNGVSREKGLLAEWPKEGPTLLWSVGDLGAGYSTPSVVGDRLYLTGNEGLENEFVEARSTKNGQRVWSSRAGKVGNPKQEPNYPGARSTPTVQGKSLYALGSDGDLVCLESSTGKERWRRNLRTDFGGKPGEWAYAESPLLDGNQLVCTPGGTNATLIALNKNTGAVIWQCAVPGADAATYASAIVVKAGGRKQYVQFLEKGLVGVDAKTGKFLWRYEKTALGSPAVILTPLAEKEQIYSGAYRAGGGLVKLKMNQGEFEPEPVYFSPKLPIGVGGVVKVGEYFYGSTGQAYLCVEFANGTVKWEDRALAPAASCFADGRLYLHGENGDVALVEPTPEAYRAKGRFTPPEQPKRANAMEKPWAYPVVANGRLYIRNGSKLWCYDIRRPIGAH